MDVDVDVENPPDLPMAPHQLDRDSYVVEDAETGGGVSCRVMETSDWVECVVYLARHDALDREEGRAQHILCRLEDPLVCGRVSLVEGAVSQVGGKLDVLDVLLRVEELDQVFLRLLWGETPHLEAFLSHFIPEPLHPRARERVRGGEGVEQEFLPFENSHRAGQGWAISAWTGRSFLPSLGHARPSP